MNPLFLTTRLSAAFLALALAATAISAPPLRADDPRPPVRPNPKAWLDRMARQQEIMAQPEGIHKISDGTICIKSGKGLATVHADLRGCGTGCTANIAAGGADGDLMAGVVEGLLAKPQEGEKIGIKRELREKILAAYSYMDYEHTDPNKVLKLYQQYAKAAEGQARADAEKALLEKVRAVGQAYIDAEVKKIKDVKSLLTPDQALQLKVMGGKMLRPFEKPIA
jgi:Spy/CpxP family protein refolding chaperone